jgi:hypothetical protein
VVADISATPLTQKIKDDGKKYYMREFDVVLLVGLTELKAQIRWIDSVTVSFYGKLILDRSHRLPCRGRRGWKKGHYALFM